MTNRIEQGVLNAELNRLASEYVRDGNEKAEDFTQSGVNRIATYQQRGFNVGVKSKAGVGRTFDLPGAVQFLGMHDLYFRGALPLAEAAAKLRQWTAPVGLTASDDAWPACYEFNEDEGGPYLIVAYGTDGNSSSHIVPEAALSGQPFQDPMGLVNAAVAKGLSSAFPAFVYCLRPIFDRAKALFADGLEGGHG